MNDETQFASQRGNATEPVERRGPGRPKGSKNRATIEKEIRIAEDSSADKAAEMLKANKRSRELHKEDVRQEEFGDSQYFLRCHRCDSPGIFFTEYPESTFVAMDGWFSTYKGVHEPMMHREIRCQECNEVLRLDATRTFGEFNISQNQRRFIDCDEKREERIKESRRVREELKVLKGVPTLQVASNVVRDA